MAEKPEPRLVYVRIDEEQRDKLKSLAPMMGMTLTDLLNSVVGNFTKGAHKTLSPDKMSPEMRELVEKNRKARRSK